MEQQESSHSTEIIPWILIYFMKKCEECGGFETKELFSENKQISEFKLNMICSQYKLGKKILLIFFFLFLILFCFIFFFFLIFFLFFLFYFISIFIFTFILNIFLFFIFILLILFYFLF